MRSKTFELLSIYAAVAVITCASYALIFNHLPIDNEWTKWGASFFLAHIYSFVNTIWADMWKIKVELGIEK